MSRHLLHAVTEPLSPEDPAYGHRLEEANPEQRHPGATVEVHQLEGVDTALQERKNITLLKNITDFLETHVGD